MTREAIVDQVAGILVRHDIKYATRDDGEEYLARFGSAGVYIGFADVGGGTVVIVRAPIVQDLELDDAARQRLLERLNELNAGGYYARLYLHEKLVQAECDLLGEELHGAELMNALSAIARLADDLDDQLVAEFGGKTFEAKWEETAPSEEAVDT
jgi:Putative bacterial sensory transduction regulator